MASEGASDLTVEVKTLPSGSHTVTVPASSTVEQLKAQLASTTEVPANRQRLLYLGRELPNTEVLSNLSRGSSQLVIHMVQRPRPEGAPAMGSGSGPAGPNAAQGGPRPSMGRVNLGPNVQIGGMPGGMPLPPGLQAMLAQAAAGHMPGGPGGAPADGHHAIVGSFSFDATSPGAAIAQATQITSMINEQVNAALSSLLPPVPGIVQSDGSAAGGGRGGRGNRDSRNRSRGSTGAMSSGPPGGGPPRRRYRHILDGLDRMLLRFENVNMETDPMPMINRSPDNVHRDAASSARWSTSIFLFLRSSRPVLLTAELSDATRAVINRVYAAAGIAALPAPGVRSFPVSLDDGGFSDDDEDVDRDVPTTAAAAASDASTAAAAPAAAAAAPEGPATGTSASTAAAGPGTSTRLPPADWHLAVPDDDLLVVAAVSMGATLRRFMEVLGNTATPNETTALVLRLADRLMELSDMSMSREDILRSIHMIASYMYRLGATATELSRGLQYLGSAIQDSNAYLFDAQSGYIHLHGRRAYPYVPRPLRPETSLATIPAMTVTVAQGPMPAPGQEQGAGAGEAGDLPAGIPAGLAVHMRQINPPAGANAGDAQAGATAASGGEVFTGPGLEGLLQQAGLGGILQQLGGSEGLMSHMNGMIGALSRVSIDSLDVNGIASEITASLQGMVQQAATEMRPAGDAREAAAAAGELASRLGPQIAGHVSSVLTRHLARIRAMPEVREFEGELEQLNRLAGTFGSAPAAQGEANAAPAAAVRAEQQRPAAASGVVQAPPPAAPPAPSPAPSAEPQPSSSTAAPAAAPSSLPAAPAGLGLSRGRGSRAGPSLPARGKPTSAPTPAAQRSEGGTRPAAETTTGPTASQALRSASSRGRAPAAGGGGGLAGMMSSLMNNPDLMQMASSPAMQQMAEQMMGGMQGGAGGSSGAGGGLDLGALMNAAGPMLGQLMGGGGGGLAASMAGNRGVGRAAAAAPAAVDLDTALLALPDAEAARWRAVIEADIAAQADMSQPQGVFSEAYMACMPPRAQGGVLSMLTEGVGDEESNE